MSTRFGSGTLRPGRTFERIAVWPGVEMLSFDVGAEPAPDGRVRVVLTGEIDIVVADLVLKRLMEFLERDGAAGIEVDLSRTTLLDAAGVGTLLAARKFAIAHGRALVVDGARGTVRRVLEITGALELLNPDGTGPGGTTR